MALLWLILTLSALHHLCSCENEQSKTYLLFSTWHTISRVDLDGSNYTVLVDSSSNIGLRAVDYHTRLNTMFWNHYRDGIIYQSYLNGTDPKAIVTNITRPSGLAIDWINDKLYFSFGDNGSNQVNPNHLEVYDIETGLITDITMLIPTINAPFHDLAVDPVRGLLYWTTGSRLVQSSLSGENVEVVFEHSCYTQYLGLSDTHLYWSQTTCGNTSFHSLNLTSLQETLIANESGMLFSDVTAYDNIVYWTVSSRINSAPATGDGAVEELLHVPNFGSSLRGIVVVETEGSTTMPPTTNISTTTSVLNTSTETPDNTAKDTPTEASPTPQENQSSDSIVIPLVAGLAVSIFALTLFVFLTILAVVCGMRKHREKTKSSNDAEVTTSVNVVYEASRTLERENPTQDESGYEPVDPCPGSELENDMATNEAYEKVQDPANTTSQGEYATIM